MTASARSVEYSLETTTMELLWGMMHSHDITNAELVRRALGLVTPKWRPRKLGMPVA